MGETGKIRFNREIRGIREKDWINRRERRERKVGRGIFHRKMGADERRWENQEPKRSHDVTLP